MDTKLPNAAVRPDGTIQTGSHYGVFTAEVRDGRLVGVTPHAEDPDPTPIIDGLPDAVDGKVRISRPMVRKGYLENGKDSDRTRRGAEPFVPVSWDQALDLVAGEVARLRADHGNESIFAGSYGWASAGKLHYARHPLQRFLNGCGGFVYSVTSYSFGAAETLLPHIVGTVSPVWGPATGWKSIMANTRLMVMFGGAPLKNTQLDPGGPLVHDAATQLKQAREVGIDFVYVSPLRDDMADFLEAEWLPARPGSDTAIMLALAHTLAVEGLHDQEFLDRYCVGFEQFLPYLLGETDGQPKDPEWAAAISELPAETIRNWPVAWRRPEPWSRRASPCNEPITASSPSGWRSPWPPCLARSVSRAAVSALATARSMASATRFRRWWAGHGCPSAKTRWRRFIPVGRISDMLLHPGRDYDYNGNRMTYPDIKMVYWCGGNPFHHHQDINRLLRAWQKPETIIIHDCWWTSAARHADIVLPATTTLERNDFGGSFLGRHLFAMPAVIDPVGEARNDFDIFADLADRLGFRDTFTEGRSEMEWLRHVYDVTRQQAAQHRLEMPSFDDFWASGEIEFPEPEKPFVMFEDFRDDPTANPLNTPSGKIEIFSRTIDGFDYDDCRGHPMWIEPTEWLGSKAVRKFPLHLISNQPKTRLHGQLDSVGVSRSSKVAGREPIRMNPSDAAARGLEDGDVVRVYNDRGACLAGLVVSDDLRRDVVHLATGAWYDPLVLGEVGTLDRHGNPNMLTRDKGTSRLGQGVSAHSALVEIERYDEMPPEITVFSPPVTD